MMAEDNTLRQVSITLDLCIYLMNDPSLPVLLIALEFSLQFIQQALYTHEKKAYGSHCQTCTKYMRSFYKQCILRLISICSACTLSRTVRRKEAAHADSEDHCPAPGLYI